MLIFVFALFFVISGGVFGQLCDSSSVLELPMAATGSLRDRDNKTMPYVRTVPRYTCSWIIDIGGDPDLNFVELDFFELDFASLDALVVFDYGLGEASTATRIFDGASSAAPTSVQASDTRVLLRWTVDEGDMDHAGGFALSWKTGARNCARRVVTTSAFNLSATAADFGQGRVCEYLWAPNEPGTGSIDWLRFHFTSFSMREPDRDQFLVFQGRSRAAPLLLTLPGAGKYSGDVVESVPGTKAQYTFDAVPARGVQGRVYLLFVMQLVQNPLLDAPANFGWRMEARPRTTGCPPVRRFADRQTSWFDDGSGPTQYLQRTQCEFVVEPPSWPPFDYLELTVHRFQRADANEDRLRVWDGDLPGSVSAGPASAAQLAARGTGNLLADVGGDDKLTLDAPLVVRSSGRRLRLTWSTGWSPQGVTEQRGGWLVSYAPRNRTCPLTYLTDRQAAVVHNAGVASAPGYQPGDDCEFLVTFDRGLFQRSDVFLNVQIPLFALRVTESVTVYAGPTAQFPVIKQWTAPDDRPAGLNWDEQLALAIGPDPSKQQVRPASAAEWPRPLLLVRFRASTVLASEETINRGFALDLSLRRAYCPAQRTLTGPAPGFFDDGSSSVFMAPRHTRCRVDVAPAGASPQDRLVLRFPAFSGAQPYDELIVYDGTGYVDDEPDSAVVLARFQASTFANAPRCPVVASGPSATVRFVVNSAGSVVAGAAFSQADGFTATYDLAPRAPGCPLTRIAGQAAGSIDHTGPYELGQQCEWLIDLPEQPASSGAGARDAGQLYVLFSALNVRPGVDVVELFDGPTPQRPVLLSASSQAQQAVGRFSDFETRLQYSAGAVLVRFTAGSAATPPLTSYTGFRLEWRWNNQSATVPDCSAGQPVALPAAGSDHGHLRLDAEHYRKGMRCRWLLRAPPALASANLGWQVTVRSMDAGVGDILILYEGDVQAAVDRGDEAFLAPVRSWSRSLGGTGTTAGATMTNQSTASLYWYTDATDGQGAGWTLDFDLCAPGGGDRCRNHAEFARGRALSSSEQVRSVPLTAGELPAVDAGCPLADGTVGRIPLPSNYKVSDSAQAPSPPTPTANMCPPGSSGCPCRSGAQCDGGGALVCSATDVCVGRCVMEPGSLGCPCLSGGGGGGGQSCAGSLVCEGALGCLQPELRLGSPGAACLDGGATACLEPSAVGLPAGETLQCLDKTCVVVLPGDSGSLKACGGGPGCRCEATVPPCSAGNECVSAADTPFCRRKLCTVGTQGCPCITSEQASSCLGNLKCTAGGGGGVERCLPVSSAGQPGSQCAPGNKCFSPARCNVQTGVCEVPTAAGAPTASCTGSPGTAACACLPGNQCSGEELICYGPTLTCMAIADLSPPSARGAGIDGGLAAALALLVILLAAALIVGCLLVSRSRSSSATGPKPSSMRGGRPVEMSSQRRRKITRSSSGSRGAMRAEGGSGGRRRISGEGGSHRHRMMGDFGAAGASGAPASGIYGNTGLIGGGNRRSSKAQAVVWDSPGVSAGTAVGAFPTSMTAGTSALMTNTSSSMAVDPGSQYGQLELIRPPAPSQKPPAFRKPPKPVPVASTQLPAPMAAMAPTPPGAVPPPSEASPAPSAVGADNLRTYQQIAMSTSEMPTEEPAAEPYDALPPRGN